MSEARPMTRREQRIQEYTEQLVREGWPYTMAYSRARDAYFSQDTRAPHLLTPRFTPELRAQFVEDQARSTVDLTGTDPAEYLNEQAKYRDRGTCCDCGGPKKNATSPRCRSCANKKLHEDGVFKGKVHKKFANPRRGA